MSLQPLRTGISQSSRLAFPSYFLFVHCHSLGSCLALHFAVILCFVFVFFPQRYMYIYNTYSFI